MLKVSKKAMICTLASSITLALSLGASPAYATSGTLGVGNVIQLKSNWCWAAADYAILSYYGKYSATQTDIVNYEFSTTDAPNIAASGPQAQDAMYHFGVSSYWFNGTLPLSTIQSQIAGNQPIWAGWKGSTNVGHVVVIYGYDTAGSGMVFYMDPETGTKSTLSYSSFCSNSNHTWVEGLKDVWAY